MIDAGRKATSRGSIGSSAVLLAVIVASSIVSGCDEEDPWLVIVARSDLVPHEEVDRIEVELVGVGVTTSTDVGRSASLREGLPIYERRLATLAGRHVRITFFFEGDPIATRDLVFDHLADRTLNVLVPRLCVDVGCDDGETCVLGQCAEPSCVDGDEPSCPGAMCTTDEPCAVDDVPCAAGSCTGGTCVAYGDDDACAADEWCDPLTGCSIRRGHQDAATQDAATQDTATQDTGAADGGAGI